MTDNDKATPWRLAGPHSDGSDTIVAADGRIVCGLMPHEAAGGPKIVRAVNAHDDMLAALKKITNNWGDLHPKDYAQAMAAIRKAEDRAAIAKAAP